MASWDIILFIVPKMFLSLKIELFDFQQVYQVSNEMELFDAVFGEMINIDVSISK